MSEKVLINYIEMPSTDLASTKAFFSKVFDWSFIDYGPDYAAFNEGIDGGFYRADVGMSADEGSALVVLKHDDLESVEKKVVAAGGKICKPIFSFPGGKRFHFCEPAGNEFAVWCEY